MDHTENRQGCILLPRATFLQVSFSQHCGNWHSQPKGLRTGMTVMTTLMPGAKLPAFYVQVKVKSNHLSRETTPPKKKKLIKRP
jgi:hypothetical protein